MSDFKRGGAQLAAVIKTDGYGHGAAPIAQLFEHTDYVWGYAVATLEEAVSLREAEVKKPTPGPGMRLSGSV